MEFIDNHFTAFMCLAYTGIVAWFGNKVLTAVVSVNAADAFKR